jgi:ADP-ribose pyrophosphatase YjhB (NUDIX family)
MQMYKVFINDCPIILTADNNFSTSFKKVIFNENEIINYVEDIFNEKLYGICIICTNLKACWRKFQTFFKVQKAAGGKVQNFKNEILFIFRFQKWDLPKGKIEKGEFVEDAAVREVEEECGIKNLTIQKKLPITYHIFEYNDKLILKITYWYSMTSNYTGLLKPQTEEGIEVVEFKNEVETKKALENTYENIKLLF